jgi:predicted dehydrogenase
MAKKERGVSRRDFVRTAVAASTVFGGLTILGARSARGQAQKTFKVGLIGCGGRGSGAVRDCINAGKFINVDIKVVALADAYKDRTDGARNSLNKEGQEIPEDRCFAGFDAYKKLIATDVEVVLTATSPNFRPVHFAAAIEAGKHVFMEKPVAVDPVGCRMVIEAGEEARKKGLMVVAGTQRRHQRNYIDTAAAIQEGAYGKILGGRVSWCMGKIFSNNPINPKGPEDLVASGKWQLWIEMSGDHICEQHVHNLDIANWYLGAHPLSAVAFGGRARRVAGNMYDFFSGDLEYPGGVHIHSICRQVGGCWNWVGESFIAEKGPVGGVKPKHSPIPAELPFDEMIKNKRKDFGGHQQEHINMLYYLLKGKELNEARNVAEATATAVLVRTAAYTGQKIEWKDMMEDPKSKPELYNLQLKPSWEDFEKGSVVLLKDGAVPVPGKE